MTYKTTAAALCIAGLCVSCHPKSEAPSQQTAVVTSAQPAAEVDVLDSSEIALGDKTNQGKMLRGFYESHGGWRWTKRAFAVALDAPRPDAPTYVDMDFNLANELMNEVGNVTLTARVNGQEVGKRSYDKSGRHYVMLPVPLPVLKKKSPVEVEFELDKAAKDQTHNGRELGLIAVSIGLKHYAETEVGRETLLRRANEGYKKILEERRQKMPLAKQNELMRLFHDIPVWEHMYFHKVQIEKNPLDLWMMQQIMFEVQPDFVVETGTAYGGSALYWAHTLNGMGLESSRVITVDISDYNKRAKEEPLWKKYVTFLLGSSTDPAIVSKIAERVKGKRAIVCLDSDHSMAHVLQELKMYSPMVNHGSYLVVEDTHIDGVPTQPGVVGPLAAVQEFLAEGGSKDFEQDLTREAYIMTFNPGGWLKRR